MSGSVNRVQLIGNLARDPDIRTSQTGREYALARLITSQAWKVKESGERREKVQGHNVVVWAPGVVNAFKHLKKGSKILVEGRLETRKYTDAEGRDRYITEVVHSGYGLEFQFMDSKKNGGAPPPTEPESGYPEPGGYPPIDDKNIDDEIPF